MRKKLDLCYPDLWVYVSSCETQFLPSVLIWTKTKRFIILYALNFVYHLLCPCPSWTSVHWLWFPSWYRILHLTHCYTCQPLRTYNDHVTPPCSITGLVLKVSIILLLAYYLPNSVPVGTDINLQPLLKSCILWAVFIKALSRHIGNDKRLPIPLSALTASSSLV